VNRIYAVQVSDTTMLKKEQMPVAKKKKKHFKINVVIKTLLTSVRQL
jgi:hypothetical protein